MKWRARPKALVIGWTHMHSSLRRRFNVTEYGEGPVTLFFIHGLGTSQAIWRKVAPAFSDRYRILMMDLMGCGGSDATAWSPARYASLEGHAQDVLEVAESLSGQNTVLVLHSIAAMIGLMAELKAPHVFDAHVKIAPSPCYRNLPGYPGGFDPAVLEGFLELLDQDLPAWARAMSRIAAGSDREATLADEVERELLASHPAALQQFARVALTGDFRERVGELFKPTLILHCRDDAVAPAFVGQYMAERMADARLAMLDEDGHFPQLSVPAPTIAALRDFLDGLGLAGR